MGRKSEIVIGLIITILGGVAVAFFQVASEPRQNSELPSPTSVFLATVVSPPTETALPAPVIPTTAAPSVSSPSFVDDVADKLRDPVWQGIGGIAGVLALIVAFASSKKPSE
jgi:hypothetical protein